MKSLLRILLASFTCLVVVLAHTLLPTQATNQTPVSNGLHYVYFGQKIPLKLRQDTIAAVGKPPNQRSSSKPFYLELRQQLQGITRSGGTINAADIEVKPLGEDYALVSLATTVQDRRSEFQKKIEELPSVEKTLPVLTRNEQPRKSLSHKTRFCLAFSQTSLKAKFRTSSNSKIWS